MKLTKITTYVYTQEKGLEEISSGVYQSKLLCYTIENGIEEVGLVNNQPGIPSTGEIIPKEQLCGCVPSITKENKSEKS